MTDKRWGQIVLPLLTIRALNVSSSNIGLFAVVGFVGNTSSSPLIGQWIQRGKLKVVWFDKP